MSSTTRSRLTNEVTELLDGVKNSTPEVKLKLLVDLVPLVRWRRVTQFNVEKLEIVEAQKDRLAALTNLLNSIPESELTEDVIATLLTLEESVTDQKLFAIRKKVVGAIQKLPQEKALRYLPRLRTSVSYAFNDSEHEDEWFGVVSGWLPEQQELIVRDGLLSHGLNGPFTNNYFK